MLFFYIGLLHFTSKTVEDMTEYSEKASKRDKVITKMEWFINTLGFYTLHIIRLVQYPMVLALGYYIIKINLVERNQWTHDKEEKSKKFCEANNVHIAEMTLIFQLVYGALIMMTWVVMWMVDREDDLAELEEQKQWQEEEQRQKGTIWGQIREVVLVISMRSFFDGQVAGTFLALAIALPHESCNIHVTEWFLVGGVVFSITDVLNELRRQVEMLAALDGIINKIEHRLILVLRFINFPLFCVEFITFLMLSSRVVSHRSIIQTSTEDKKLSTGEANPHFCERGTWNLMVAVMIVYCLVIIFRVAIVVGTITQGKKMKKEK
eukprot:GFUD01020504.1.p2 GENE.GFUD01020504.1~~GFUD01020504.1.p2  ORF type:complete len:333 (+),score=122.64 GFUD01020504.1:36-1001(+)